MSDTGGRDGDWTPEELDLVRRTGEVHVSSQLADGSFTRGQTIWAVTVDGGVYIRSTDGADKPWFRTARTRGEGRFEVGGSRFDVTFIDASDEPRGLIDTEYGRKYRRSPEYNVNRAAGSHATLRLLPR